MDNVIYLDIETSRPTSSRIRSYLCDREVKPRANLKDPEKIAADIQAKRDALLEATPLNPMWGEVAVICWSDGVQPIVTNYMVDEALILERFNNEMGAMREAANKRQPVFCGFSVGFDLRFLWTRMQLHGIKPTANLQHDAKPWSDKVRCLRHLLTGGDMKAPGTLQDWVVAFGGEARANDIPGKDVPDAIEAGRIDEVVKHCLQDVRDCIEIDRKLRHEPAA